MSEPLPALDRSGPQGPKKPRVQSGWLGDIRTWITLRNARRRPIEDFKEITVEYAAGIQAIIDEIENLDISGSDDIQISGQEFNELVKTIDHETKNFERIMKNAENQGGVWLDFMSIVMVLNGLVDEFKLDRSAARVKNAVEAAIEQSEIESDIGQSNSVLVENLEKLHRREDLEPVMRWAEEIIAAEPATSFSQAGKDTLSQEKKSEFGKLEEHQKWAAISTLAAAAVLLFPSLSPHGAAQTEQQEQLRVCDGISTLAAAVAIRAGMPSSDALSLLELGRGIIAASRYEIREDLTLLKASPHKDLADEFEELRDSLDSCKIPPKASPEVEEEIAQQLLKTSLDLEDVVKRIRECEGFDSFLLPPSADELKSAADEGPIIIVNVSFQCDAILIHSGEIESIPLQDLNESDINKKLEILKDKGRRENEIEDVLEWLWNTVAGPVLEKLGFTKVPSREDEWPRVWWVLTGSLALFPIHAAGKHRELQPGNSVLDRVVSSYSPTVKALFYAREDRTKRHPLKDADKIVLVSMEDDKGLQYVKQEIEMLSTLLPTPDVLESPSREAILDSMHGCKIFHFSGHAESDFEDPSRSRLIVSRKRDPVTVLDVAALKLYEKPPLLAYLSACSTANGESDGLLDEGIHVMGAFQLAGFQNVIGSLWELYDARSQKVATNVYEFMKNPVEGESVALALHKTLRAMRLMRCVVPKAKDFPGFSMSVRVEKTRSNIGEPVVWAAYIHMGV